MKLVKNDGCTRSGWRVYVVCGVCVDEAALAFPCCLPAISTFFTQVDSGIEFLPDFGHLFADEVVEFDRFFDFFD